MSFHAILVHPSCLPRLSDDTLESVLVPLDGLVLVDAVGSTDLALASPALGNTLAGAGHADVEVHTVDTARCQCVSKSNPILCHIPNARVVLDAQVDVLADTETEVAGLGEVALAKLVLLDLEATLENLLGLGATDGNVDGNLFVPPDTEGSDGVAGLAVDGSLTAQLLEHLCGTRKSVTRLADGDVEDELLDAELPHGVGGFGVGLRIALAGALALKAPRENCCIPLCVLRRLVGWSVEVGRWLWVWRKCARKVR